MKKSWLPLLVLLVSTAMPAVAAERILSFHSYISVQQNGDMIVREVITVNAEGNQIKRGIYRDFPTTYKDHLGNRYQVGFMVMSVERNGQPENFHTENRSNGIRTYFGNRNRFLSRGTHKYEFTYRTNRQLGFFQDHDELYWNVTGNGWDFAIEQASATVRLPTSISPDDIRIEGYTGAQGSKAQNYLARISNRGLARIEATQTLPPRHGLTLVVSFPKGHVHEPTSGEKLGQLANDNRELLYLLGGLLVLLAYYLVAWSRVGRDQQQGVIIPLYYPPKGYSPASMRFVSNRRYDKKTFATALVNLAVKGLVFIDEDDGEFTVRRNRDASSAEKSAGENALLSELLGSGDSITIKQSNHSRISKALAAHEKSLKRDYEKIYFVRNRGWIIPGALITIGAIVLAALNGSVETAPPTLFLVIWLSIWSLVVYFLFANAYQVWRSGKIGHAIRATMFAGVFGFFEVMGIFAFTQFGSPSLLVGVLLLVGTNAVFYHLLHADTRAGRRLMDQVEGFRQYLDVAEGDELKMAGGPSMTPDLFEMYLPYALALNVEQRWAERFANVFADLERQGRGYHPRWYHGSHWHHGNIGGFTNTIGSSLSASISSSSTAPGSSSGGGGGGFSGGGGGGGGGGGW